MNRSRLFILAAPAVLALAACSPAATPAATPAGSAAADAPRIAAKNVQFDRSELTVPAARPFTLVFDNQEAVPHNVAISGAAGAAFTGEVFNGPAQRDYQVPALTAGSYTFVCSVHPNMTGTLTAR